jgi:hypothetical protein
MDSVNERSTWLTTVPFTNENKDAVVPTKASYRIDDVGSDQEIRTEKDLSALAEQIQIMWEPSDTSILDESHPYETRRLTVFWTYDTATSPPTEGEGHAEYLLNVVNLKGVTTPSPA